MFLNECINWVIKICSTNNLPDCMLTRVYAFIVDFVSWRLRNYPKVLQRSQHLRMNHVKNYTRSIWIGTIFGRLLINQKDVKYRRIFISHWVTPQKVRTDTSGVLLCEVRGRDSCTQESEIWYLIDCDSLLGQKVIRIANPGALANLAHMIWTAQVVERNTRTNSSWTKLCTCVIEALPQHNIQV